MSNPNVTDSANQFTTQAFLDPYGIFMPQNRRELLMFQRDEYFMTEIFQALQMTEPVEGRQWYTWVEPKKVETVIAASAASAGATDATVDIVIKTTPSIVGGVFARIGDVYRRNNGDQFLVVALNKGTATITAKPPAGTNIAAVAANETFVLMGNNYPEASDPRAPMTGKARQIQNQLQIMQEIAQASGSVQTDKTWFEVEVPSIDGVSPSTKYWFSWEIKAMYDRMMYQINNTLITGSKVSYDVSSFTANFGTKAQNTAYGTGGLIPQAVGEGAQLGYSAGEPSMQWFFKVINTLIANQGDKENIMFNGMQFSQANTSWVVDQFKNGAITYGAFTGNSELAVKIGFNSFETQGYTFHWKDLAAFNNPDGLGAQGFTNVSFLIPTTPIKTSTGNMAKPVRMRYKQMQGNKMLATAFRYSTRNNQSPTSPGDYDSVEMIGEWGAELLAPWKSLYIYKQ